MTKSVPSVGSGHGSVQTKLFEMVIGEGALGIGSGLQGEWDGLSVGEIQNDAGDVQGFRLPTQLHRAGGEKEPLHGDSVGTRQIAFHDIGVEHIIEHDFRVIYHRAVFNQTEASGIAGVDS